MYREDWLIRQIRIVIQGLARILFGRDDPTYQISGESHKTETDLLHEELLELLRQGRIGEAEDRLFARMEPGNIFGLLVAIDFYNRLNDESDEYLESHDFSREEIESGLRDAQKAYHVSI